MNHQAHSVIEFEMPTDWCQNPAVAVPHQQFVANLFGVFADLNATVKVKQKTPGDDFVPRQTESILFSYHSVGKSPNVWRVKEGPLPYYFSFDSEGYSGWSAFAKSPDTLERARQIPLNEAHAVLRKVREETFDRGVSKYPQPASKAVDLPEQYIFFPLQVTADLVLRLARLNTVDVLNAAADMARARGAHLVLKRHPFCVDEDLARRLNELKESPWITVTDASVHQCIANATAVLCCNSGVGLEALMGGKPVYNFGDSDYRPAAEQIATIKDVEKVFDLETTISHEEREQFLALYFTDYCFDARDSFQIAAKITKAMQAAGLADEHAPVSETLTRTDLSHQMTHVLSQFEALCIKHERWHQEQSAKNDQWMAEQREQKERWIADQREQSQRWKEEQGARDERWNEERRRLDDFIISSINDAADARRAFELSAAETQEWKRESEQLKLSHSWRITAPLRSLSRMLLQIKTVVRS
jgi:hypothetical protein